jgi:C4-type Zn-finger protein
MRFDGAECPRCKGTDFREVDCGQDSYDDDITWTDTICNTCGLRHDGWNEKWYTDIEERTEYEANTPSPEAHGTVSRLMP